MARWQPQVVGVVKLTERANPMSLLAHLRQMHESGELESVLREERGTLGSSARFLRGELSAWDAAARVLERTLNGFWHSFRLIGYNPSTDRLSVFPTEPERGAVTLSVAAREKLSLVGHARLGKERADDLATKFHVLRAREAAEFAYLLFGKQQDFDESVLALRLGSGYRRLYVVDWEAAEAWYERTGAELFTDRIGSKGNRTPERFFTVSPRVLDASQVLLVAAVDGSDRAHGIASLRFLKGAFYSDDVDMIDSALEPVLELLLPFILSINRDIVAKVEDSKRGTNVLRLAYVLEHGMKHYFPAVEVKVDKAVSELRKSEGVLPQVDSWIADLRVIRELTELQRRRVERMRTLTDLLWRGRGGNDPVGRSRGQERGIEELIGYTVQAFGSKVAFGHASEEFGDIFRQLLPDRVRIAGHDHDIVFGESQGLAMEIILEELLANAVRAVDAQRLLDYPVSISWRRLPPFEVEVCLTNFVVRPGPPVNEAQLLRYLQGGGGSEGGRGLGACGFLVSEVFGDRASLAPRVIDSEGLSKVEMRLRVPADLLVEI
jgi:hypothetical protein